MRFSATIFTTALAVFGATTALGKTTNCRKCTPQVKITGAIESDGLDSLMQEAVAKFTGGDNYAWTVRPDDTNLWLGEAYFPRLCGKAAMVNHQWTFHRFPAGPTYMKLYGNCGQNVRCQGNSHCEKSEIWG